MRHVTRTLPRAVAHSALTAPRFSSLYRNKVWQWWIRVEKNLHIKATAYHLGLMVRAMLQPLALLTLLAAAAVRLNAWSIAYALSVGTTGRVSDTGSQPHTHARSPAAHLPLLPLQDGFASLLTNPTASIRMASSAKTLVCRSRRCVARLPRGRRIRTA